MFCAISSRTRIAQTCFGSSGRFWPMIRPCSKPGFGCEQQESEMWTWLILHPPNPPNPLQLLMNKNSTDRDQWPVPRDVLQQLQLVRMAGKGRCWLETPRCGKIQQVRRGSAWRVSSKVPTVGRRYFPRIVSRIGSANITSSALSISLSRYAIRPVLALFALPWRELAAEIVARRFVPRCSFTESGTSSLPADGWTATQSIVSRLIPVNSFWRVRSFAEHECGGVDKRAAVGKGKRCALNHPR
jgi:hypothetical protein